MKEREPAKCAKCVERVRADDLPAKTDCRVEPGTLYCWRHAASPPKIGDFTAEGAYGQLLWRTTSDCTSYQERLLAVFVEDRQVTVRRADEDPPSRPTKLVLELSDGGGASRPSQAIVAIKDLYDAIRNGHERIEARQSQ